MITSDKSYFYSNLFSFTKEEKLCSKKEIEFIFKNGDHIFLFPFKVYFLRRDAPQIVELPKILISVPKRNFKKAVTRNLIKRLIREAYRLNKSHILKDELHIYPNKIAFIYIGKEVLNFQVINEKLILVLLRLKNIR